MKKLILINPNDKTIKFVERKDDTLSALYELTDCTQLEGISISENLTLMFDEEARLKEKQLNEFIIQGQFPILGKGILCRNGENGEHIDSTDEDLALAKKLFAF